MNVMTGAWGNRALLALLMLIFAVNMLDRQILGIALPGIRADFHLSDTALGLLTGPAFALVYVLLGIPLAVLADRGHTRAVIAGSLGLFSLMTLLCGAAGSFTQLLAARFGVGVGEAGTAPALNAMIAARVPPEKRTGALSVYAAGGNLGLLLAFFGGGLIMQHWGWRITLTCAGIPGFLVMLLFLAATRAPARTDTRPDRAPLGETIRFLWRRKSFRFLVLASGLTSISGYAALAFLPSFLQRSHHLTHMQIGLLLGGVTGVIGFFGTMLPGLWSDRMKRSGLSVPVITLLAALPFQAAIYLSGDLRLVIPALTLAAFFASSWLGPSLAAAQALVPTAMRAQTAALLLAALNLIGMAVGPLLVGAISELLRSTLGEESLRIALFCSIVPSAAAVLCFVAARRRMAGDMT
jgi:predicted MFS family arabinose efflux permease